MTKEETWLLLKEGFSAQEISAAAGVSMPVALGMINEAVPRSIRAIGELSLRRSSLAEFGASASMPVSCATSPNTIDISR